MNPPFPRLILASRSPRRRELLRQAGYRFDVMVPHSVDERPHPEELPEALVARLAHEKAYDVARRVQRGLVLGCDTVAECDGQVLGKPRNRDHAREMLLALSGRPHRVLSGLCLWPVPGQQPTVRVAQTVLRMDPLSTRQLNEYLDGGQWEGKAGAFGYQDRLGWVHVIEGSETNVVGLPTELLAQMLHDIGNNGGLPCT